ncbi:hypothetical protein SAMN04244547_04561 [Azotobacter vinelandii]|nr:hypothetical protein SAMN04244547_04561 [Azotobacter vinelandii]
MSGSDQRCVLLLPRSRMSCDPGVGDNVRVAADVGMYAQTFLLALAASGYRESRIPIEQSVAWHD